MSSAPSWRRAGKILMNSKRDYELDFQLRYREVEKDILLIEASFMERFADGYLTYYERAALKREYRWWRLDVLKWKFYVWCCETFLGWRRE